MADVQYSDFLYRPWTNSPINAAKLRYMSGAVFTVPMATRAPVGETTRGAQHGQSLDGRFSCTCPDLRLPARQIRTNGRVLLKTAIRDKNPVIFFNTNSCTGARAHAKRPVGSK